MLSKRSPLQKETSNYHPRAALVAIFTEIETNPQKNRFFVVFSVIFSVVLTQLNHRRDTAFWTTWLYLSEA